VITPKRMVVVTPAIHSSHRPQLRWPQFAAAPPHCNARQRHLGLVMWLHRISRQRLLAAPAHLVGREVHQPARKARDPVQ
jgi:hypothetical protein